MQENQQTKVLTALQLVLRPIVKLLLRYGIGYSAFAEIVKTVFVDVGSSEFGIRGRPTNISRVAVMTGLTRKEVRRLRLKLESGDEELSVRTTPITQILTRWHSEPDFLDVKGRPATLQFSDSRSSFTSLVKRFGGDVPAGAMRTELKRMQLIEENGDGSLSVLSRSLQPQDSTENLLTSLVHCAYPLLSTIEKNTEPTKVMGDGYAQFATYSLSIGESDRTRIKRMSYDRLSEAAVSFDDLFVAYEPSSEAVGSNLEKPVVMVGLYYFEETDSNVKYKW